MGENDSASKGAFQITQRPPSHTQTNYLPMTTSFEAFLSRGFTNVLAQNLVVAGMSLGMLAAHDAAALKTFGLTDENIEALRSERPSIPTTTLDKLLDDSWRTCCICKTRGQPIVVHHIREWKDGGSHEEGNLVVLCLNHHNEVHLRGGHAIKVETHDLRKVKSDWITLVTTLKANHLASLALPSRGARWFWIHLGNLMSLTSGMDSVLPEIAYLSRQENQQLIKHKLITSAGRIAPTSMWSEPLAKSKKYFEFDSGAGIQMGIYVSDLLGRFVRQTPFLDLTPMLELPDTLRSYVNTGVFVYFEAQIEVALERAHDAYDFPGHFITGRVSNTGVRIEFQFDPWTALTATSKNNYLRQEAQRAVIGQITNIMSVGNQVQITVSPLGISPDFVLHDPTQGAWVQDANNTAVQARKVAAKEL